MGRTIKPVRLDEEMSMARSIPVAKGSRNSTWILHGILVNTINSAMHIPKQGTGAQLQNGHEALERVDGRQFDSELATDAQFIGPDSTKMSLSLAHTYKEEKGKAFSGRSRFESGLGSISTPGTPQSRGRWFPTQFESESSPLQFAIHAIRYFFPANPNLDSEYIELLGPDRECMQPDSTTMSAPLARKGPGSYTFGGGSRFESGSGGPRSQTKVFLFPELHKTLGLGTSQRGDSHGVCDIVQT
ncbi:hypothetical protein FB45DRAFT_868404 [Roridomyces roridus]|uniref:Uncharacterized protein n=1 Tax=Roridomyces roridus TaxID=1738132 RepID=A0AAD7BPY4_9AGAR|nr:hypothetical protein FB45DRAFT_868404 [Roridomyces roridus]